MGYNSKPLTYGQQMISASFIGVGSEQTFWVSDLKISGYQTDPMYTNIDQGGGQYDANFFILDFAGRTLNEKDRAFSYHDEIVELEPITWDGGQWSNNGKAITPHGANDYQLQAGDGIYFSGQAFTEGYQPHMVFPTAVK